MELSIRPTTWTREVIGSAPEYQETLGYQVLGLPAEQSALINKMDNRWQILHHLTPDDAAEWDGDYSTAEEALAALAETCRERSAS